MESISNADNCPLYEESDQLPQVSETKVKKTWRRDVLYTLLSVINIIGSLVISICCFAVGVWIYSKQKGIYLDRRHVYSPAKLLIFSGCLYFITTCVGLIGNIQKKKSLILIYLFLVVIVATVQVVLGYISFSIMRMELNQVYLSNSNRRLLVVVKFHLQLIGWMFYIITVPMMLSIVLTYNILGKLDNQIVVSSRKIYVT